MTNLLAPGQTAVSNNLQWLLDNGFDDVTSLEGTYQFTINSKQRNASPADPSWDAKFTALQEKGWGIVISDATDASTLSMDNEALASYVASLPSYGSGGISLMSVSATPKGKEYGGIRLHKDQVAALPEETKSQIEAKGYRIVEIDDLPESR